MRITILVDNAGAAGLRAEHGLSLWIEARGRRILFDTGQGNALRGNARGLRAPLERTDTIVLSHGHYDHAGGLAGVLKLAPAARLIVHPSALFPRFSLPAGKPPRSIGFPPSALSACLRARPGQIIWATRPVFIARGVGVTGPIVRRTAYEDSGGPFYLDTGGREKDPFADDQALWIESPAGVIVCVGCCHAGLVNTLNQVRRTTGARRIRAVIGGFHLGAAGQDRLRRTADALGALSPELMAPCHCTGEKAVRVLRKALGEAVVSVRAGSTFTFR